MATVQGTNYTKVLAAPITLQNEVSFILSRSFWECQGAGFRYQPLNKGEERLYALTLRH